MAFPGEVYAPPSVYTQTEFENPIAGALAGVKIPVFIGEGNEYLIQSNLEVVRGSSASVDQYIVQEDETGHAVLNVSQTGVVTLGAFDGVIDRFQVRNWPIVSGNGTGTTTNDRSDVAVTIDGDPIVVLQVDGGAGFVRLAQPPPAGSLVRCTYYFNRTDTLVTDDVSDQVDDGPAFVQALAGIGDVDAQNTSVPPEVVVLHDDILSSTGQVAVPANNVLSLTVDGDEYTLELPPRSDYTMAQVATTISSFLANSLTASTFINNFGMSTLQLNADHSIVVGSGSANAPLGLQSGQADNRVKTFYTYQGPIVDGSNGGVTTTDPANVTVKVNNVQVIPDSVDGASRAVTLPLAPKAGATVTIQYWFNTWQDTFDHLANIGVVSVDALGEIPNASTFIEGADFVLQNNHIVWGTSVSVTSGEHTQNAEYFGDSQISTLLIDNKTFMSPCTPTIVTSGGAAQESQYEFELPFEPTTGNGRDTKLGQSLFQSITNSRIDLPANRPDLIDAYWGYDEQDALDRGKVEVSKVEGLVITLKDPVPVGANVYATFYYNWLADSEYTLTSVLPGPSGTGTYSITDSTGTSVLNPTFNIGSKGTALNGITLEFPSGSEMTPGLRHEPVDTSTYLGPVKEIVTVQFESRSEGPARYTSPGSGEYSFIEGQSDRLRVVVDGTNDAVFGTAGHSLTEPNEHGNGFFASLAGNEVTYTGGTGATVGQSYEYATDETLNLLIDGVQISATIGADPGVGADVTYAVPYINEASSGHGGTAGALSGAATLQLDNTVLPHSTGWHPTADYYVGWTVVVGTSAAADNAQTRTVTAYDETTGVVTVDSNWSGGVMAGGDTYYIYNPSTMAEYKAATRFNGPVTLGTPGYERLSFSYIGSSSGPTAIFDTAAAALAGTYATAADLAAQVEVAMNSALVSAGVGGIAGALPGLYVYCESDPDGRLVFKLQVPAADPAGGALLFVDNGAIPALDDFAILAGIDTGSGVGSPLEQAALIQGAVARAYTYTASTSEKPYDRIILRNRLLPGGEGTLAPVNMIAQMGLEIQAGNANDKLGLVTGMTGEGWDSAVVHPATLIGRVGWAGGQIVAGTFGDDRDLQPALMLYDGTGTVAQNNLFDFDFDGQPITVEFTDATGGAVAGTGSEVPLGPGTIANTVLWQISNAMFSLPGNPLGLASATDALSQGYVLQEGPGIRITSALSSSSSSLVIGTGNANSTLGLLDGTTAERTLVSAKVLASALMSHYAASLSTHLFWTSVPDAHYFTSLGLATVETNDTGNDYLYVQSLQNIAAGAGSSVQFLAAALGQDALFTGTRLDIPTGGGSSGESALDGFFVVSNNAHGSGSANTSVLNPGVVGHPNGKGQDGIVGQTYRDDVTGLTFTILPRGFLNNENGPWLSYPSGTNATFLINVTDTFVTDANIPHNAINGVELTVSNTTGVTAGDTALVETFNKGGKEPAIGDIYYVTYTFQKQNFTTSFYTKMSAVEAAYGAISPDNPVSLAAYLAFINGAIVVGIKQVPRAVGEPYASLDTYAKAIEELEGVLPGQVTPDIITPLRGDSTDLYMKLRRSNAIQSSIRYKAERTSIIGMSSGSVPQDAITLAKTLDDARMRLVYPDTATLTTQDALGNLTEHLIDGPMLAAGLAGSVVSANVDVATPWTGRLLVGYTQLARRLDAVQQNQVAVNGVTILEERPPFLRVRHGLTTDMENVLTKTPTIILIADEVQRQARIVLDKFIGQKFLPGLLSQIEGRLSMMLNALVKQQIIAAYTGVKATVAADDPTVAEVEAYYQPIFPLLYIVVTFHLRSNL